MLKLTKSNLINSPLQKIHNKKEADDSKQNEDCLRDICERWKLTTFTT